MIHVRPNSEDALQDIGRALGLARRVLVVTGAGTSAAAGLPDRRSEGGLYAKGDIFCAAALAKPRRMDVLQSALRLHRIASGCEPTKTHRLIRRMRDSGRLLRCYTSNVDWLDAETGLSTDLRGATVDCVPLHGSVRSLQCPVCRDIVDWDKQLEETVVAGQEPLCQRCLSAEARLRPNIFYVGDEHRLGEVADFIYRDRCARPDLLLVLGASLKIGASRDLVKRFAAAVRANGGTVIHVNPSKASGPDWDSLIDYWVEWDCDSCAEHLSRRERLSQTPCREAERVGGSGGADAEHSEGRAGPEALNRAPQ
ncbi:hypothetical protein NKR23_g2123 [Pleurostoma richardsiae]|uniref:Deacetylase sirtuin-type domain-containing protein n=1 Tax=Pleurostoma richardsiae TaxID=41990 RepID=A0AA38VW21_9PEZI|nr:hypothetical protein NKR23_g2123 [Pleurostoma richardsiae]